MRCKGVSNPLPPGVNGACEMKCRNLVDCDVLCKGDGACKPMCKAGCQPQCLYTGVCAATCVGTKKCEGKKGGCKNSDGCETRCAKNTKCTVTAPLVRCMGRKNRCGPCQQSAVPCTEAMGAACWRRVCQQCMDSPPCCQTCLAPGLCPTCASDPCLPYCRHPRCMKCNIRVKPPCLNCASIIAQLGWGDYNNITVNEYNTDCSDSFIPM